MIKKVVSNLYVHKSNLSELLSYLDKNQQIFLLNLLDYTRQNLINYDIIKYNLKNDRISLIECETWNTLNEPIVGDSYCFYPDYSYKLIKGGTKVYHNKWQFVSSDYTGFNIEKAKKRTCDWQKISEIRSNKSKIGNKKYWYAILTKYGLDI